MSQKKTRETLEGAIAKIPTTHGKIEWLLDNAKAEKITQIEFANSLGMTSVWINKVVRGANSPSVVLIEKIARFFNVRAFTLFDEKKKKSLGIP